MTAIQRQNSRADLAGLRLTKSLTTPTTLPSRSAHPSPMRHILGARQYAFLVFSSVQKGREGCAPATALGANFAKYGVSNRCKGQAANKTPKTLQPQWNKTVKSRLSFTTTRRISRFWAIARCFVQIFLWMRSLFDERLAQKVGKYRNGR